MRHVTRFLICICVTTLTTVQPNPLLADADTSEGSGGRPNIILIMADDVGYECFGCYGSQQYKTPHVDRLAAEGMRFEHCYSQPLCTPSRVKLMTGLSNVRNYSAFSVLNRNLKTIGQYFEEAGYRTCVAGKWQLFGAQHYSKRFRGKGTMPRDAGFDRHCLWQIDKLGKRYWGPLLNIDGKNKQFGPDEYGPDIATRFITDFIAANDDKPYFIYYPMILVHNPFLPTPDSASRASRNRQRNFEEMVSYMDKLVGRIERKVEELGQSERTLILFVGDNGTNKAIHSKLKGLKIRGGKGQTTDAGTRVSLVAKWSGTIPAGQVNDDLIDFSDFLPTLLQAARVKLPTKLDGQSFLPQLTGQPGKPREWMYCYYCPRPERTPPVRFVRDRRWKLYGDGKLFDVANDPLERQAIVDDENNSGAAAARKKLLAAIKSMPAEGATLLKFGDAVE